jgi:4-hydroxybenzoate polyprenyltransferase
MTNRWWVYQKERFPIFAHGPMVIVFCLSIMLFSSLQEGEIPGIARIAGAVLTTLILFFQLRVADEFKDFKDDSKYRPHRAVPRGVISLRELAWAAWIGAAVQFVIAVRIDVGLVPLLILVWLYMGLMTREFFVPRWLKSKPSVYLTSHMLIMPMIAFYVSAFDWLCDCRAMPAGLGWLLLFSFGCGLVLEIGRKIKAPDAERTGVETYSSVWGVDSALAAWLAASIISVVAFVLASAVLENTILPINMAVAAVALALIFAGVIPAAGSSKVSTRFIEPGSGLFAMLLYLGLGPLQVLVA